MKKLSTEEFIVKAKAKHGDKYDYSLVEYVNNRTKIEIICPEHGSFFQIGGDHLKGKGCKYCADNQQMNNEQFIAKAVGIHGDKYDYSLVEYKGAHTKITIICKEHGSFECSPTNHLKNRGCPVCRYITSGGKKLKTLDKFIIDARKTHGNKYDYSKSIYVDSQTKLIIICPEHGEFFQTPNSHISGCRCIKCNESKGEKTISDYLNKKQIMYKTQTTFKGCRFKKPLFFDFYLPEQNICIEYDGRQHFEAVSRFGGETALLETQQRDDIKTKYCQDNKIKLLRIPYTEFDKIEEILEEYLK